ncbi:IucA/IucC family protein [Facilibium subflavum]|uniref:IucA/IucC family protein n=1 Tax=Facilibium subflavum TaxID=2219058 RepID=UPI000E656117|nr:IucA/IucC family protein [Facilibium subflavum]
MLADKGIKRSHWCFGRDYIIKRLIDTFIREKIGPFSHPIFDQHTQRLYVRLGDKVISFVVKETHFLQCYQTQHAYWFEDNCDKKRSNIISLLRALYRYYQVTQPYELQQAIDEYKTAVLHHIALPEQKKETAFAHTMLYYEHLASRQDHPLFPTARAKLGFSLKNLAEYTIEYQASFRLLWFAVDKRYCAIQGKLPDFWPQAIEFDFDDALLEKYQIIPVHPFSKESVITYLKAHKIPYYLLAKAGKVTPGLSVRSVFLNDYPHIQIKLPLAICTLSAKNIRTIKPSTIHDGALIQQILHTITTSDAALDNKLLLTDESCGGSINQSSEIGFIVRRYPKILFSDDCCTVSVASLTAQKDNKPVIIHLADTYFNGQLQTLLTDYIDLILQVHLPLVLTYGIALEANQQNSTVVIHKKSKTLQLLLKDNDTPRIDPIRLTQAIPSCWETLKSLKDTRIIQSNETSCFQMFSTIIWQLNLACILQPLIKQKYITAQNAYQLLYNRFVLALKQTNCDLEQKQRLYRYLCIRPTLDIKYLYTSGTFLPKTHTFKGDINKFYGNDAKNFLHHIHLVQHHNVLQKKVQDEQHIQA